MTVNLNSMSGVGSTNMLDSMDIETALMAVSTKRAELLENQLRTQLTSVADTNKEIARLNQEVAGNKGKLAQIDKNTAVSAARASELSTMRDRLQQVLDRDPNHWTGLSWGWGDDNAAKSYDMLKQVRAEGLVDRGPAPKDIDNNGTMDAHGSTLRGWIDQLDNKIAAEQKKIETMANEKEDINISVSQANNQVDSLSNTQQMDMLRLQALSNKRNEAYDIMTNFVKKMQDSRSGAVANLR